MNNRETIFSSDRRYRYTLWRETGIANNWFPVECKHGFDACPECDKSASFTGRAKQYVQFIGLNPSTADETKDDATIRRCISFAKRWGFGAMCMTNIFAFRATDPRVMKAQQNPVAEPTPYEMMRTESVAIGNRNDLHLYRIAKGAELVIAAWGVHGDHLGRAGEVRALISQLYCLGRTKDGKPRHPLYVIGDTQPILL